ncbi:MAG: 30S ribosomal protein S8 [Patescibacteria group bacterium]|nr:30S ribosomal protein S8 [Patescibacteria group bacterium]MBU1349988.1 30S ribosomal protein S8 [Patescibacteria group bacterium]MBU1421441.1 30S ribosomal protein S8 [Patescibacteria group bacterium]MBU1684174.1 30S ribosomal protein S8 [Patescibacteria group bacterium]MBU2456572.1 30S ribosomal protein S8 [Patescibacteria group bacterium]
MTDPIADMLTRIRNASVIKKSEVILGVSKIKREIAEILKKEGWVHDVKILKAGQNVESQAKKNKFLDQQEQQLDTYAFDQLKIILKYKENGKSEINNLKRISKPGLRIYAKKDELPKVLNNFGIAIISTPQGLMTNKEARKKKVGGEIICEIY